MSFLKEQHFSLLTALLTVPNGNRFSYRYIWRVTKTSAPRTMSLTTNAISMLYNQQSPVGFEPWLQVIDIKKIKPASGNGSDRYRIILSDGASYISGMLAKQLVPMMQEERLKDNFIVQLKDYIVNDVQGRRILIVLSLGEVIASYARIGNPQSIENAQGAIAPASIPVPKPLSVPPTANPMSVSSASSYKSEYGSNQTTQITSVKPPQQSHSTFVTKSSGPIVRESPDIRLSDIQSLNPYAGGRWTIKARVTTRSPVKNWTNARGAGKLFSVDLLDSKGGEIRATMFNDAVDKFYEILRPDQVFLFSGGKVRMANRKFSSLNNDYELTFDANTEISLSSDDHGIQHMRYDFTKIATLESLAAETNVDIIGIVKDVTPLSEIVSKAGKQLFKRDVLIMDDSMAEVKVTLWNERAKEDCDGWVNHVLAIKGCRISEYNGRSVGTLTSSAITVDPAIPEAGYLVGWYNNGGSASQLKSLSLAGGGFGGGSLGSFSERSLIQDIKGKQLGYSQKPDYITIKGTVNFIKHDSGLYYQACTKCQKKVVVDVAQNYSCEKCQTVYKTCENRYIMSLVIMDHTGSSWVSCFNDQGKIVMNGRTADEIAEIKETNSSLFESIFKEAFFKEYVFRLRIKAESVQEELRVKVNVANLQPINYTEEAKNLLEAILQFS